MGIQAGMSQRGKSITSSVSPELFLLHSLACLQLLRKLARQVAFTFFESKDIFRELATRARPRANPSSNSRETEEVRLN